LTQIKEFKFNTKNKNKDPFSHLKLHPGKQFIRQFMFDINLNMDMN